MSANEDKCECEPSEARKGIRQEMACFPASSRIHDAIMMTIASLQCAALVQIRERGKAAPHDARQSAWIAPLGHPNERGSTWTRKLLLSTRNLPGSRIIALKLTLPAQTRHEEFKLLVSKHVASFLRKVIYSQQKFKLKRTPTCYMPLM
jgi:hypothetical protein